LFLVDQMVWMFNTIFGEGHDAVLTIAAVALNQAVLGFHAARNIKQVIRGCGQFDRMPG
jgi:hypothetical protein